MQCVFCHCSCWKVSVEKQQQQKHKTETLECKGKAVMQIVYFVIVRVGSGLRWIFFLKLKLN